MNKIVTIITKCSNCNREMSPEMELFGKPIQVVCEVCGFGQLVGSVFYGVDLDV